MSHLGKAEIGIDEKNCKKDLMIAAFKLLELEGCRLGKSVRNRYVDQKVELSIHTDDFSTGIGITEEKGEVVLVSDPYGMRAGYSSLVGRIKKAYTEVATKRVLGNMGYKIMSTFTPQRDRKLVATKG